MEGKVILGLEESNAAPGEGCYAKKLKTCWDTQSERLLNAEPCRVGYTAGCKST